MAGTIEEINRRIVHNKVRVVTAEEMTRIVNDLGPDRAAERVDVVTTGTFGAMCSSGVWFNFGHSDPPIKISRCWLNDVPAYSGVAAVDAYLGAAQFSDSRGESYGGAHVIEDLVRGKRVALRAEADGTDCYPRREVTGRITLKDLNQALMSNPRNSYQKYAAAANSGGRPLSTYMGRLAPFCGNVTYSGAGELSPINNDPGYRSIGIGTRILLGGAVGYVTGSGTQHSPGNGFGTLMLQGDLKRMSPAFLKAAVFRNYGPTLYMGIGIPIPVPDAAAAAAAGIADRDIRTPVLDYGVSSRERPVLAEVSYAELKSGRVRLDGKWVRTACLSSLARARAIAGCLKRMIGDGAFRLTQPVASLSDQSVCRPMPENGSARRGR